MLVANAKERQLARKHARVDRKRKRVGLPCVQERTPKPRLALGTQPEGADAASREQQCGFSVSLLLAADGPDAPGLEPDRGDPLDSETHADADEGCEAVDGGAAAELGGTPPTTEPLAPIEHLQLGLEEAFFLCYGLGCLIVHHEGGVRPDARCCANAYPACHVH